MNGKESFLKKNKTKNWISVWTFCLNPSLITLRLEKNACLVMIKCSSCFSLAQGPSSLCKETTKLQHKLSLFIILFRGIRNNVLFFYSALRHYHDSQLWPRLVFTNWRRGGQFSSVPVGSLTDRNWMSWYHLSSYQQVTKLFIKEPIILTALLFIHD